MKKLTRMSFVLTGCITTLILFVSVTYASHAWGTYHWGRTANPLPLELGDNVSTAWDNHLATASTDWNVSGVLDTSVVAGKTKPRSCRPKDGRIEICSNSYGNNGWLGIAQIWISGSHIVKGAVKVNDTYFDTPSYNTPAWRNLVMCQEVGHIFGLGHQDEVFNNTNLGTCMDYTSDPTSNQHPNQHDYDQLASIYAHLDSVNTYKIGDGDDEGGGNNGKGGGRGKPDGVGNVDLNNPSEWGKQVSVHLYERDLGNGKKIFTHVIWVDESHQ